jgi:hypothetical protein
MRKMSEESPNAYYAINVSKISPQKRPDEGTFDDYIAELDKRISGAVERGMSVRSVITPLLTTGCIFGPFENERGAMMMAASDLDENKLDYFGVRWGFIKTPMTEMDFEKPLIEKARVFVCTDEECRAVQRFKGSCSRCKSEDKPLVKTILVRDWDGVLQ